MPGGPGATGRFKARPTPVGAGGYGTAGERAHESLAEERRSGELTSAYLVREYGELE